MSKKGFELAINLTVILILAITVFTLGLIFVAKLFGFMFWQMDNLDDQIRDQLRQQCSLGVKVAYAPVELSSARGEPGFLGVGINNILDNSNSNEFKVNLTYDWFQATEDSEFDREDIGEISWDKPSGDVKNNGCEIFTVAIRADPKARRGKYAFTAQAYFYEESAWHEYGQKQKIYLNVP